MPSVNDPKRNPKEFHASDLRFILVEATKSDVARKMLEDFVGAENVNSILEILGLSSVEEMSTGVGMAGPTIPLGSGSDDDPEDDNKKNNENMAIAKQVLKLIKERGILR